MYVWYWLPALILAVVVLALWLRPRGVSAEFARALFQQEREPLGQQFFQAAARSGKPRGLRWVACEWDPDVVLARDRKTGQFLALVGVTISFEAIEGGDMEGLPAVGNLRNASAVFAFDGVRWSTNGRAVFNLNPAEAIAHFGSQYERVAPAAALAVRPPEAGG